MPSVKLSRRQEEVVRADDGPICVKASAGSGKTRVLTERVRFLLARTKKKVLALTFTNRAGEEIRERLDDIPDLNSRVFIGTFHGFCQYMLENHGAQIGLSEMPHIFEDDADRIELIEKAVMQTPSYAGTYRSMDKKGQKDYLNRALKYVAEVKRRLLDESELRTHADNDDVVLFYRSYQDLLHAQNAIDFDDLLLLAYNLLSNHPQIAALYRRSFYAICIDEAQDLNNAQYQLLLALTSGEFRNIMMVGDPNQSIYHFNGASPKYMNERFVEDFNPTIIKLKENYRSSKRVLSAARKVIPEAEDVEGTVIEGVFEIAGLPNEEAEADWIVQKIQALTAVGVHPDIEGGISFEKIAVLARNRYIFQHLANKLDNAGFPYFYKMSPGPLRFESDYMQCFDLALRVRLNPNDALHRQRLYKRLGVDDLANLSLADLASQIQGGVERELVVLVEALRDDGRDLKAEMNRFRERTVISDDNERNLLFKDIDEFLKHWHNYSKKSDSLSLRQFKNAMALGQTHPLTQHKGITLSTVHTMKGQEYDIVFLMGMDQETFPDYRAVRKGGIDMTQEKNNLYVAFTRAKRFLYVTWPQQRLMPWGDVRIRRISDFLAGF